MVEFVGQLQPFRGLQHAKIQPRKKGIRISIRTRLQFQRQLAAHQKLASHLQRDLRLQKPQNSVCYL